MATSEIYNIKFDLVSALQSMKGKQGCDLRARGNHARGLKNSLHVVFTRYLRGNHVRYIYGNILKNTANTGDSVFFLVVGGRRAFKFRAFVCGALAFLFILSFSLRALSFSLP